LIYYVLFLGIALLILGLVEFILPKAMLTLWTKIILSKAFWVYGLILIILGFPLTQLTSNIFSVPIFIIGVCMVFFGPFVIIYPDTFRNLFIRSLNELSPNGNLLLLHVDAIAQMAIGTLLISAYMFR